MVRLVVGGEPRQDRFWGQVRGGRSDATEVAEGVLIAASREPEERKIPYLGYLLAHVTFYARVSGTDANSLVRQVDRLSYRQLSLLALCGRTERQSQGTAAPPRYQVMWRALRQSEEARFSTLAVLGEIEDFDRQGFVEVAQGVSASIASSVWLFAPGNLLYDLLELRRVPAAELDALDALLQPRAAAAGQGA